MSDAPETVGAETIPAHVLESIVKSLSGLRFGQVTVIIHDGRVTQIDRTERQRFASDNDTRR